jgi:Holliday junction DNA helicase RuvA
MYSYICGKIRTISPTTVLLDNGGLGFQIQISLHTYSAIKDLKEVQLFTHCILKNENQAVSVFAIYGFAREAERILFMQLISVSGVGNNTAQLILSSFGPSDLVQAIASGNVAALQRVKGIGSKTAQRIIVDLRDKIAKTSVHTEIPVPGGNTLRDEALSALLTLGFARAAAEKALDRAFAGLKGEANVESVIKAALNQLST